MLLSGMEFDLNISYSSIHFHKTPLTAAYLDGTICIMNVLLGDW